MLAVSRNTVALAYQLLRDDGMAESRQGSGTRIVPHRVTPAAVHRANGFFTGMLETSAVSFDLTLAAVECAPQWRADWLRPRYDAAAAALRAALPGWTWTPPSDGLTIWARLPGGLDSDAFAQAALRRGVALVPWRLLSAADGGRAHLRLAFTRPPEHLTAAIATLGEIRP